MKDLIIIGITCLLIGIILTALAMPIIGYTRGWNDGKASVIRKQYSDWQLWSDCLDRELELKEQIVIMRTKNEQKT